MTPSSRTPGSLAVTVIFGVAACLVVSCIVIYPDQILESSLEGLSIWWKIVFPALLPFLIIIEIMTGLGIMHFTGGLLDPVMRRLFRMPGLAGWCLAVGWLSGAPAAARQIAKLRKDGVFTRHQAEQLMGLAHAASPVLVVTVISAGFLAQPGLGLPLLAIHWLSAALAAIAARQRSGAGAAGNTQLTPPAAAQTAEHGLLLSSLRAMEQARTADGRPIGRLLGDSVFDSIQKLMVIGGYMIFFSVLIKIVLLLGIGQVILQFAGDALQAFGLPSVLATAGWHGLFEQHLGTYALHSAPADRWTMAAVSGMLGWSGWCLHAQAKAAAAGTDLRYRAFLAFRLTHAMTGTALTLLLYPLLGIQPSATPGFQATGDALPAWSDREAVAYSYPDWPSILQLNVLLLVLAAGVVAVLAFASAAIVATGRQAKRR